jgi:hypothetical protein
MRLARVFGVAVTLVALAVLIPIAVLAEPVNPGQGTVQTGPIVTGPVTSNGSGGYGPGGISAGASSSTSPNRGNTSAPSASSGANNTVVPQAAPTPGPGCAGGPAAEPGGLVGPCPFNLPGAPAAAGGPAPSPLELAEQASAEQPWPALRLVINPGTGLTGMASWFWVAGDPQMPNATASAGPLTVTVHAGLSDVSWDFGDGAGYDSGGDLGRPYPAASTIQHVYETDTYGRPDGYEVTALVQYQVTYSVNGGPFQPLGSRSHGYSTSYQVEQLQPQGVGG